MAAALAAADLGLEADLDLDFDAGDLRGAIVVSLCICMITINIKKSKMYMIVIHEKPFEQHIIYYKIKNVFILLNYYWDMILSVDGILFTISAFVNALTMASFLGLGTENTIQYARHPLVRMVFLYTFAFSVVPQKVPCLIAVALFVALEVKNFVTETLEDKFPEESEEEESEEEESEEEVSEG